MEENMPVLNQDYKMLFGQVLVWHKDITGTFYIRSQNCKSNPDFNN